MGASECSRAKYKVVLEQLISVKLPKRLGHLQFLDYGLWRELFQTACRDDLRILVGIQHRYRCGRRAACGLLFNFLLLELVLQLH